MKTQLVNILIAIVIVSILSFGISAVINNKPEVIKETADTIYVKRYNVYNTRIDTISYPQPPWATISPTARQCMALRGQSPP